MVDVDVSALDTASAAAASRRRMFFDDLLTLQLDAFHLVVETGDLAFQTARRRLLATADMPRVVVVVAFVVDLRPRRLSGNAVRRRSTYDVVERRRRQRRRRKRVAGVELQDNATVVRVRFAGRRSTGTLGAAAAAAASSTFEFCRSDEARVDLRRRQDALSGARRRRELDVKTLL